MSGGSYIIIRQIEIFPAPAVKGPPPLPGEDVDVFA